MGWFCMPLALITCLWAHVVAMPSQPNPTARAITVLHGGQGQRPGDQRSGLLLHVPGVSPLCAASMRHATEAVWRLRAPHVCVHCTYVTHRAKCLHALSSCAPMCNAHERGSLNAPAPCAPPHRVIGRCPCALLGPCA